MGLKVSPDIAQAMIEEVLKGLDVVAYIDDIGIWTDSSMGDHIKLVDQVLSRLQENGFTVNPLKCEWAVKESNFLGYWMTPDGIKPWKKKIEAVLRMQPPTNASEMRSFLGMVTFYRTMWPRRSHILAPLTELSGRGAFQWTQACQGAFDEMKAVIAADAMLAYPNPNKPFAIYTDASDYQMGAAIMQEGRPIAYWSKKLDTAQRNYATIEKELLAVVM